MPSSYPSSRLLFVHQNFPGQFLHLAPAMAHAGNEVRALHINPSPPLPGVQDLRYSVKPPEAPAGHRWLNDLQVKLARAEACWKTALSMKAQGFEPDAIVAHPGWGESLLLKEVWPRARLGIYCEFYYHAEGADSHFDPEFSHPSEEDSARLRFRNANHDLHFSVADAGLSPTEWQKSVFPDIFRDRISAIHDGIDTTTIAPRDDAFITVRRGNQQYRLSRSDELITFVNRNLEPYRGYHVFMRALPDILAARPKARVVIVGGDEVSYGARAPEGKTWRQIFLDEVKDRLDLSRVHFVGKLPRGDFTTLLQSSTVHVYLTYPFVLSWSLMEAMSTGCAIVASDTAPVREVIRHGETGLLFDFFSPQALTTQVCGLLADAEQRKALGSNARRYAVEHYDLQTRCLPGQMAWVERLLG
jgi:glycosyltransferase involved in cell wall biosynthesis